MISYRALKKLIGESSLERKCRFLFGFALLFLITASFWLYESRTRKLVETQQLLAARMLVKQLLDKRHYSVFIKPESVSSSASETESAKDGKKQVVESNVNASAPPAASLKKLETQPADSVSTLERYVEVFDEVHNSLSSNADRIEWSFTSATKEFPESDDGFKALQLFLDESDPQDELQSIQDEADGSRKFIYFAAIRLEDGCRRCHKENGARAALIEDAAEIIQHSATDTEPADSPTPGPPPITESTGITPEKPPVPLLGIVRIKISLESVDAQLSRNRAILLATAIVTSFLAMLAAYAIVRYIIVKPVQHLKDVSDEIARGNLNLRADISTGDEFEELSHAFNRMLRHMMTVNDELRSLNDSLDGKIDQLAQANMELFNNNKLKDDFLATISHELRTPLNSILGFSDILQSAVNLDDRQKRYVHNIQSSGQSLMVQINDLLDLAKIESGKMELHSGDVFLNDILELQVQQIMPLADRKNIDLRIEAASGPLPMLFQDHSKIRQILTNLLSNAIKFTPEGGRVRVASRIIDAETVEFSVEDSGIGIPLQEQEHIFEKFRQGSTVPGGRDHVKREYEGTGLGLSIVRELARLLGGDVSLRSEFGKGSLFVVRLPVRTPEKRTEPDEPALESRSSTSLPLITTADLMTPADSEREPQRLLLELPLDVQSI